MLIIDPNDAPHLPSACLSLPHIVLPGLEDATGCDIVLSTWDAPTINTALRWQHVEKGVGYQLKRGADLIHSIHDGRIMNQLARMHAFWGVAGEKWLVHVADIGVGKRSLSADQGLVLYLDGAESDFLYKSYLSAIRNWQRSGGHWLTLSPSYPFEQWITDEEERIKSDPGIRLIRKPEVKLHQLPPQVETLATFPLLGPTRAVALWRALKRYDANQTLTQALVWLSSGFAERVEGIGKGVTKRARGHLGLGEKEHLALAFNGDWPELKKEHTKEE